MSWVESCSLQHLQFLGLTSVIRPETEPMVPIQQPRPSTHSIDCLKLKLFIVFLKNEMLNQLQFIVLIEGPPELTEAMCLKTWPLTQNLELENLNLCIN